MRKNDRNLMLCGMVFAISLVTANVVTGKIIDTGIPLFGSSIQLPGAALCYAITFLMTDVVGEIWGRKEAATIVKWGFVCQIISTVLIVFTQFLPASDSTMQEAYNMLLGQNAVFVIGSLTGYLCSQSWDVWVFHKIRNKFIQQSTGYRKRWIWNNASTMSSQVIDTVVFIGIAFGLGFGWLFDPEMLPALFAMMIGQYLLKFLLALCDTPLFYLMTHKPKETVIA